MENHPADRGAIVKALTDPKLLPSPASTPSNTDVPGQPTIAISSQYIKQEDEDNLRDDAIQHESSFIDPLIQSLRADKNQDESLFIDAHTQGSPVTQQRVDNGVPLYEAYVEDTDDSSDDSQPSRKPDDWLPTSDGDDRQDGQLSRQAATSSISQQSGITQYKFSKRKQNFEGRRNTKRLQVDALDGTEVDIGRRSPQPLGTFKLQPAPDRNDKTNNQQPGISEAVPDSRSVAFLATLLTTPEKGYSSRQISSMSGSPIEDNPSAESDDRFADLPADLKSKALMIGDMKTLGDVWHFFYYMGSLFSISADAQPNPLNDMPSASLLDQRLRKLKTGIIRLEKTEKAIKSMKMVTRVSKRVYLAELVGKYIEEIEARKAEAKKGRRKSLHPLSIKNRYTDLLFPETITDNGKQLSKEEGKQILKEENGLREKAKEKLE